MGPRNSYRISRARRTIRAYRGTEWVREPGREEAEETMVDLITDVRYLADQLGLDWTKITDLSDLHYAEEIEMREYGRNVPDGEGDALAADVAAEETHTRHLSETEARVIDRAREIRDGGA